MFVNEAESWNGRLSAGLDPARSEQRLALLLLCLEGLYREIDLLKLKLKLRNGYIDSLLKRVEQSEEIACRGIWMMHRLIEQARCEEFLDRIEQVQIDARVAKHIDPDFSFAKAVIGK